MDYQLANKTALVTGGGRGIGRAICKALTDEGVRLAVCDINLDSARETAESVRKNGKEAFPFRLDVSRPVEIYDVVAQVRIRFGKIDILVNNAGICPRIPIDAIKEDDFDRIVGVNLKGTFFMSQALASIMKEQRSGSIINISSIGARTGGVAASSVYAATKAGIIALTKSYARLLAPYATANAIAPGVVDTDMMKIPEEQVNSIVAQIPLGRMALAEEIASLVLFLASPAASYFTGATLDVNGGWFMY